MEAFLEPHLLSLSLHEFSVRSMDRSSVLSRLSVDELFHYRLIHHVRLSNR